LDEERGPQREARGGGEDVSRAKAASLYPAAQGSRKNKLCVFKGRCVIIETSKKKEEEKKQSRIKE